MELRLPSGRIVAVSTCFHHFKPWQGAPIPDTYGGKAVLDSNGDPLFAELAILRLIQAGGWQGAWIDTYRRKFRQSLPPHLCNPPPHVQGFLCKANAGREWRSGCPDVLAWSEGEYVFVEAKHKGRDRIGKRQKEWLESAINSGLPLESYLIFEWTC